MILMIHHQQHGKQRLLLSLLAFLQFFLLCLVLLVDTKVQAFVPPSLPVQTITAVFVPTTTTTVRNRQQHHYRFILAPPHHDNSNNNHPRRRILPTTTTTTTSMAAAATSKHVVAATVSTTSKAVSVVTSAAASAATATVTSATSAVRIGFWGHSGLCLLSILLVKFVYSILAAIRSNNSNEEKEQERTGSSDGGMMSRCPWPFIVTHDPMQFLKDSPTWMLVTWFALWRIIKIFVGSRP
jgi:hypothetical protein